MKDGFVLTSFPVWSPAEMSRHALSSGFDTGADTVDGFIAGATPWGRAQR